MSAVRRMKKAFNLCCASESFTDKDIDKIHFYQAVRSVLYLILTYIFSVYSKVDVVIVSEVWLPQDFFMAVSSGIFASLLVVVFVK